MLIAGCIGFGLCVLITPVIIMLCKKNNWYDEVDPRKVHQGAVPRLGGVGLFLSFIAANTTYIFLFAREDFSFLLPVFAGGFIIWLSGIIDDFANLRARLKFIIQIAAALIVSCSPLFFHRVLGFVLPSVAGRVLTFLWILTLVNAYNLIDGLDWLCSGLSLLTVLTVGFILNVYTAAFGNMYFILAFSIAGFMVYNKPQAKIFLGDGGSQTLGYMIAVAPLCSRFGYFEDMKLLTMILLVSIPVTDVLAAVWRRKRDHRSFFSADRAHIHHKLVNIGFSKRSTVAFILFLQALICFAALGTLVMKNRKAQLILLVVSILFVWGFFVAIHYINRAVNIKFRGHLADAPQEEH